MWFYFTRAPRVKEGHSRERESGKIMYTSFFCAFMFCNCFCCRRRRWVGRSLMISVLRHGPGGERILWVVVIPHEIHHFGHRTDPQKSHSLVFLPYWIHEHVYMTSFHCRRLHMQASEIKSFASSSLLPVSILWSVVLFWYVISRIAGGTLRPSSCCVCWLANRIHSASWPSLPARPVSCM